MMVPVHWVVLGSAAQLGHVPPEMNTLWGVGSIVMGFHTRDSWRELLYFLSCCIGLPIMQPLLVRALSILFPQCPHCLLQNARLWKAYTIFGFHFELERTLVCEVVILRPRTALLTLFLMFWWKSAKFLILKRISSVSGTQRKNNNKKTNHTNKEIKGFLLL